MYIVCIFVFFVYRIIGQVRVDILQIFCVIGFCSKASQSFIIDVYSQRIDRSDSYINAQIKFKAVDKERIRYVLLYNARTCTSTSWDFIEGRNHCDSTSLARRFRLHDPQLVFPFPHHSLQLWILLRTVKRLGHEVKILISIQGLHSGESFVKAIFPCDFVTSWKMVNFLKSTQIAVNVWFDSWWTPNDRTIVVVHKV